jgi:nucleoside-diphosphate-sugar epimerase
MAARRLRELVLGGEGLIGRELCLMLTSMGGEVRSLDLKSGHDLRNASRYRAEFMAADRIWFLAWEVGGWKFLSRSDYQHRIYRNNSLLCASVFEELKRCQKPFLFTTSQLAGETSGYGITKSMAEGWVRELGGVLARLWNVYGWERLGERSHVVPDLIASGLQGKVQCMSDGLEERQFLHVEDCAQGLILLVESGRRSADITSGQWVSIADVAMEIGRQIGVPVGFGNTCGSMRKIEPMQPLAGWSPRLTLREGIQRVTQAARCHLGGSRWATQSG